MQPAGRLTRLGIVFLLNATALALSGCVHKLMPKRMDEGSINGPDGCVSLVPDSKEHLARACERGGTLSFDVAEESFSVGKGKLKDSLRDRIYASLAQTAFPLTELNGASVDLWWESDLFNPARVRFVAAIHERSPAVVMLFPWSESPSDWFGMSQEGELALVGAGRYPDAALVHVGKIMVQAKGHLASARFDEVIKQRLGRWALATDAGFPMRVVRVAPFSEVKALEHLSRGGRQSHVFERANLLALPSASVRRVRLFGFVFSSRPKGV